MQVYSFHTSELKPEIITVEYNARFQIPGFQILGLPAPEIQESRERIISAFQSAELEFPKKKVSINLAPASVRKSGTGHDLAIALKVLSEVLDLPWPPSVLAWGELSLDGRIRSSGRIAHLIELLTCTFDPESLPVVVLGPADFFEFQRLISWRNQNGLKIPSRMRILKSSFLKDLPSLLPSGENHSELPHLAPLSVASLPQAFLLPLSEFQERIVKLGSLGRHHLLVLGPKGVGKSASFDWFRALASPPPGTIAWERALYQESRGEAPTFSIPLRQVHSQVRPPHLFGSFGPQGFRAGELSLAHGGILFADEFMEWPRDSKECLREPLQTERLILTRVRGTLEAKCDLQLIASGNLCPCGGFPARLRAHGYQSKLKCRCSENEVGSYLRKLSGPILDRIDLVVLFSENPNPDFVNSRPLSEIKNQISNAQEFALERFGALPGRLSPETLEALLPKRASIDRLLEGLGSLRARHKTLRVAHSIQALEASNELREEYLVESKAYRFLDSWV